MIGPMTQSPTSMLLIRLSNSCGEPAPRRPSLIVFPSLALENLVDGARSSSCVRRPRAPKPALRFFTILLSGRDRPSEKCDKRRIQWVSEACHLQLSKSTPPPKFQFQWLCFPDFNSIIGQPGASKDGTARWDGTTKDEVVIGAES